VSADENIILEQFKSAIFYTQAGAHWRTPHATGGLERLESTRNEREKGDSGKAE